MADPVARVAEDLRAVERFDLDRIPRRQSHLREIDPAVDALRACVSDAADDPSISPVAGKRLKEMLAFTELVDRWYTQMLTVPRPRLIALIKLGEKIVSFLPGKSK